MYKIAVMGDRESINGFASLGLTAFPVTDKSEAEQLIKQLADGNYAIIYITEQLADEISETVDKYRSESLPAIILIPGITGNTGRGMDDVHRSVEKAVGSDILTK